MEYKNLDINQFLNLFREKAAKERGFIASLSRNTGIPQDRMYKWRDGRGTPKHQDAVIIMEFLESVPNNNMRVVPSIESGPYHPDHAKYVALLEKNNKTFEESIQLSLNTIKVSLGSLLEGQGDLKTISEQGANNTFVLLDEVARIRDLLQIVPPPLKGGSGGNELSNYGVQGTGKKVGSRDKG